MTLAGLMLLWGAPLAAQPNVTENQLTGQADVARLVDLAAERLRISIEYDPGLLKGLVTLRSAAPMSDEELWRFTAGALAARGFTVVRRPGEATYSVVKLADAASLSGIAAGQEPKVAGPVPGYRSVVVRVNHRPIKEAVEAITKVLSKPAGAATAVGENGLLLISDLSPRVDEAIRLLGLIDVPGPTTVIEEVPVRNLSPQLLVLAVAQVAAKRDAVSGEKAPGDVLLSPNGGAVLLVAPESRREYWRDLIASLDRRERVETTTYSFRYFPAKDVAKLAEQTIKDAGDERWKLVIDELTGSLVVTATPTQLEAMQALLDRLAAAPTEARRPVRTFVIKNRRVKDIQSVLEQLLQAGVIEAGAAEQSPEANKGPAQADKPAVISLPPAPSSPLGTPQSTPSSSSTGGSPFLPNRRADSVAATLGAHASAATERPLTLTSDEGTNTLIAVGEPRLLAQIESLLKTLDVRQPQVMLEVLMVTLSEGQSLDLGVELEQIQISSGVGIRLASLFGLSKRGSTGNLAAGDPIGFTGVVLSPGDFSVIIRALQTVNRGHSLSMPKLLVGNNQLASLDSVVQQPYASVNASTTVSTTSFGGSQDAGTTVTIKPQIAEGDHLVLDYSVSLSSFVGSAAAATLPPPKQQNRVQSAATIPDGYTVVVGGIELENDSKSVSQVPLLGSIPILGEVFKSRNNTSSRSRFFVFIRANILRGRGFEDLKYVSARDVARAAVDDGLPVVEPRIIP